MGEIDFVNEQDASEELPDDFEPYVKEWFNEQFPDLSPPQRHSFNLIHQETNSLICAPTGSGKTLSAFLSALNNLFKKGREGRLEDEIQVLYVSPLRALSNDIERNLEDPLKGIKRKAEQMGYDVPEIRSAVRTGDTTDAEKRKMREKPPHIMITTPESLGIILDSPKFKENFRNVEYTIIDEIHSLCANKRGVHLSISIERLEEMANTSPTRIGLSATQAPIKEIAKYLVGFQEDEPKTWEEETERGDTVKRSEKKQKDSYSPRECKIVDVAASKEIDLETVSPVDDLIYTPRDEVKQQMYEKIHSLVQDHDSTIIFTNTRSATERVVNNLTEMYPDCYGDNIGAHHSSMSREVRLNVEEKLKKGEMKVGVTSTSLELGVDIGTVDLVLQIGSPKGVARGIQRIGRSGHQIGKKAKGKMIVTGRDEAMECSVLTKCAKEDELDKIRIPENCLDVLAQQIVGMACNRKWDENNMLNMIRRSYNFRHLEEQEFEKVIKYLSGEYEDLEDQNVYRKIWNENGLVGRSGKQTRVIYMTNIGTIPDESGYTVVERSDKTQVGDLDEEFLDRLTKGDIFTLGGSTYQFQYTKGMKVFVDSKPGAKPTVPSWYSEKLPLTFDLGTKIGKFRGQIARQISMGAKEESVISWIQNNYYLDQNTAQAVYSYIEEQHRFMGDISTPDNIVVEKYTDEDNRQNIIFQTIYGRKVHDAMARVLANILQRRLSANIGLVVDDNGFILVTPNRPVDVEGLLSEFTNINLREELKDAVRKTEIMKRRFRHVAGRSLMVLRNYQGSSKTVGQQQMKGHFLLSAIRNKYSEEFPMVQETYREIMEDAMDIQHAEEISQKINDNQIEIETKRTKTPSPFSHGLLLQGTGDVLKVEDKQERLKSLHQQVMQKIDE